MAKDKAVDSTQLDAALTSVANAIRTKGGTSASLAFPADFVSAINAISGGGYTEEDFFDNTKPTGNITFTGANLAGQTADAPTYFKWRTGITKLYAPNYNNTGNAIDVFRSMTSLEYLILPSCTKAYNNFAFGDSKLVAVDFKPTLINSLCFINCAKLNLLILRGTSVSSLFNTNSFNGTCFASGKAGGTIYIPKYLYDQLGTGTNDYKAASNWATVDGWGKTTWAQIEGSTYETQYADGTPCTTRFVNYTLTNCAVDSVTRVVTMGAAFTKTLTADSGYTMDSVTVTMNGVDVTSSVYNSQTGVINIAAVDGTIYITATAS